MSTSVGGDPHDLNTPIVGARATCTQVARLLVPLGEPDSPRLRLALGTWIAFVSSPLEAVAVLDPTAARPLKNTDKESP